MSKQKAHARLSASGAHRWLACPGSATAEALYPDQSSEYAEEGTQAHEVAEMYARAMIETSETDIDCGDTPAEMIACAKEYAAYIQEQITSDDATVLLEQKVDFSPWVPDGFGTCDCIIMQDGLMTIIDYKYGKGVEVEAENNPQMKLYALGAWYTFGSLYEINAVKMCIFQPRINNISEWEISAADLSEWANEYLRPIALQAYNGSKEFHSGEWCRFCKHAGECRQLKKDCTKTVRLDGHLRKVEALTDWEIDEILTAQPMIEMWLRRVSERATQRILAGETVPGWKLVEGRTRRKWTPGAEELIIENLISHDYTEADYMTEPELVSITTLERAIGKKRVAEIVGGYITKDPGKPTLAPVTDKRPDYQPGAEFDIITD